MTMTMTPTTVAIQPRSRRFDHPTAMPRVEALARELRILVVSAPHEHTRTMALDALEFAAYLGASEALRYLRMVTGSCVVPSALTAARLLAQYAVTTSVFCERGEHTKCAHEGDSLAGRSPCECVCHASRA